MTELSDKSDLAASQEEAPPFGHWLAVSPQDVRLVYQTSGTSGRPIQIPLTAADAEAWTAIGVRSYAAMGVTPASTVVTTLAAGPFAAGHTHQTLDRIGATLVAVAPGDTPGALAALRRGDADTLLGTPSFALHLAQALGGVPIPGLRRLILGGEPGAGIPAIRAHLEAAFGAEVREVAGIGEVAPSLFAECDAGGGMHFMGDGYVEMEVLESGELVYTTVGREALPLHRYRSHDIADIMAAGCDCGRTSIKLRIVGRSDDAFLVRGVTVHPSAVQAVVATFVPRVTGRVRVLLPQVGIVKPPVPVEVETAAPGSQLASEIADAIRDRLTFRADVRLRSEAEFGDSGYKTELVRRG